MKKSTFLDVLELMVEFSTFFSDYMVYIWLRFCMKQILLNSIETKDMAVLATTGHELITIAEEENIILA